MATEQKSIEISYKADIKDLITKLEQIPTVTKKEAKAMVAALDRQLKQAEKAAKKSADEQKKVARAMANNANQAAAQFDNLNERMDDVAEKSGDIDRGFSGIGLALRGVNPELAEAADGMADGFAVVESLIMGFGSLNPLLLAGTAIVGGLALGYMSYAAEAEKARQTVLDLREAQKELNATLEAQQDNLDDAVAKLAQQKNEFDFATQQIDKYQYAIQKAGYEAGSAFSGNIAAAKESIAVTNDMLTVLQMIEQSYNPGAKAAILSEEQQKQLRTLQLQNDAVANNVDLLGNSQESRGYLMQLINAQTAELQRQTGILQTIEDYQTVAVSMAEQLQELENEKAQAEDQQARALQDKATAERHMTEAKERQEKINERLQAQQDLQRQHTLAQLYDLDRAIKLVEFRYEDEKQHVQELATLTGEHETAKQTAAELEKQQINEIEELRAEFHQKELDRIDEVKKERANNIKTIIGNTAKFSDSMLVFMENIGREESKIVKKLFRMQQVAAIGEIVFNTAQAITAALTYPPIIRGAMIATATATGAAQTAAVASQQPPQFHMGGMAPDEHNATLLTGEAVIDRTTVRNMGGAEGIRNMQNQRTNNNNTVIIQPFKHIDRYNRTARKRMGRKHTGAY